jgi:site-specific recombinase XerD
MSDSRFKEQTRTNDLSSLITGYQLCARAEGKSENTIQLATIALGQLSDFLKSEGLPADVSQIGAPELRSFIRYLQQRNVFRKHPYARSQDRHLTRQSINDYMRSISAFWSWLKDEELIDVNPFSKVKIPPPTQAIIVPYSAEQIGALLAVVDRKTPVGSRDMAIMLTFLDAGPRVSELCDLPFDDVDLNERLIKVHGKGAKERQIPIGSKVQRAMWKYVQYCRPKPASPRFDNFFLTRDGRPLTRRHVGTMLGRYSEKTGLVGVKFSPHRFRHTFAISYLRNGGDVFTLQRILGHSSLDTVRLYLNLASVDIQAAHRRYSPVDNLSVRAPKNKRI